MKSILFKKEMYDATRLGIKTQNRRIAKGAPKYKEGNIVYVKEPYILIPGISIPHYPYDGSIELHPSQYRKMSSLFLPEKFARLFIKIESVRLEKLNDISVEDAMAEGITPLYPGYKSYEIEGAGFYGQYAAINSYRSLWEKINGKRSWGLNPEVYVYGYSKAIFL